MTDLVIDERLPALVWISDSIRQQTRRISRTVTPCSKCFRPLTVEDLCFADGKDCHRSCAEMWNFEILDGYETLKAQDAKAAEDKHRQTEQAGRLGNVVNVTPAAAAGGGEGRI